MNEERKPGALSSGFVQGSNERDEGPRFATAQDLNHFLIRRQLLAIESKRIKELLIEAESDVKAKQNSLDALRDRVRSSLREHEALREQSLREELASRESLDNGRKLKELPKIAERRIRRWRKQLFPRLKSAAVANTGRPDASLVEGGGWQLPKVRQLDAWATWFAENAPNGRKPPPFRKDRIQVAFVVSGGIGDLLKSTHLLRCVSDYFSCDLTIIAAQHAVGEVVAHNPYVRDAFVPVTQHVYDLAEHLRHIPVFDLIVVWRYHVEYLVPSGSRIASEDIRSIESNSSALRQVIEKYRVLHGWHKLNFAFSREMTRLGLSAMDISVATSGLPHRNSDEIPFFPSKQSLRVVARLLTKPYVTVHHGFDLLFLPAKTRTTDYGSTKNISIQQWRKIVSLIRGEGIDVIQLGIAEEERIEGVTHYLNGQTSLEETGLLIKHGLCHIDTEGGLVHLANAVHTRCVVLFGPTPVDFFGYPQNINLEPSGCKACWFITSNWLIECPRHTSGPECMSGHSAISVADAAKRIIAESENLSAKLLGTETRPIATAVAETLATAQASLGHDIANRTLLILDDLPHDIGSTLLHTDRTDVIVSAGKPRDLELRNRLADRPEYGSLLNLPRPSSSVDAAIWVSGRLEADVVPFALREIFRVLKPGGQLVFMVAGESAGLDLRPTFLAAGIVLDDNEIASTPVYSFSLRKNGAQTEGVPSRSGLALLGRGPEARERHSDKIDPALALIEEDNEQQITLIHDRIAQRQELVDEAGGVVDDAVERGFGADGWIWVSNVLADGYPTRFFVRGWHEASNYVISSRESKCLLALPLPDEHPWRDHALELQVHLTLPRTSASNPTSIGVCVNDGPIEDFRLSTEDEILTVRMSTGASKYRGVALVELRLGAELGEPSQGNMRMGVRRFRYRVLS